MNVKGKIVQLALDKGIVRASDLVREGLPSRNLSELASSGQLIKLARGVYAHPTANFREHQSLVEVAALVPEGVICLLTALRVHNLTTQAPFEVWLGLPTGARKPKIDYPPVRYVSYSPKTFGAGIEEQYIDGARIRVFGVEKTIADCFKYRNKIGIDVAIEALKDASASRRLRTDLLWKHAETSRVTKVIKPYMEMLS